MSRKVKNSNAIVKNQYDTKVCLDICERVAAGETITAICYEDEMPNIKTFYKWVANTPNLALAYAAARELSASSMEEEAVLLARKIKRIADDDPKGVTSAQVRAYDIAMQQLRWSAARRDPGRFASRGPVNVTVPVQINTSLDMGKSQSQGTAEFPNIYELEATVEDPDYVPLHGKKMTSAQREVAKARRRRKALDAKAKVYDKYGKPLKDT